MHAARAAAANNNVHKENAPKMEWNVIEQRRERIRIEMVEG